MRRILLACVLTVAPASALAQTPPETLEYYGLDAIGSIRIVFGVDGSVLARQDYGPFGIPLLPAPQMPSEQFGGNTTDDEGQQGYFHARQLLTRIGRFGAVDPIYDGIFEPQRWNRYSYGLNNPVSYSDANGLQAQFKSGTVGCANPKLAMEFWQMCAWAETFGSPEDPFGGAGVQQPTSSAPRGPDPRGGTPKGPAPGPSGDPGGDPSPSPGPTPNPPPGPPTPPGPTPSPPTIVECTTRWSASSTTRLLAGDAAGSIVGVAEVVTPVSLFADGVAMLAKGPGSLGTKNPYASGINWGIRTAGRAAARQGLISSSTWGVATVVGGTASVVMAPVGVFTSAYNGTVMIQCALGVLE